LIPQLIDIFATARSARIVRATLSNRRIQSIFDQVRNELGARTVHGEIRRRHRPAGVMWSLWIGRFEKSVPWLLADRFTETRYGFVLLLECADFVEVLASNTGDVAEMLSDGRVSYQKLLALRSGPNAEVETLSTRTLRAARVGVSRTTQGGRHLERALPRVGANQAAPFQVGIREAERAWRISPGSGRVAESGPRQNLTDLCSWFAATCDDIHRADQPNEFLKSFAHPMSLAEIPLDVMPTALQLDPTVIDDLLAAGATLRHGEVELTQVELEQVRQLVRELWLVDLPRSQVDEESNTWRLKSGIAEVGRLIVRPTKISVVSDPLFSIRVVHDDGTSETLTHVFNSGDQPLRITFSDPSYAYAAGQLFRDHRLIGSRNGLLEVLSGQLPQGANVEKAHHNNEFAADSLFGFVVQHGSTHDDFLVCDDLGAEWADFVGVSNQRREVTFYHCKGGHVDVGASGLHEVVSQALKNLGYLSASPAELTNRAAKWRHSWNATTVPRLQRGNSVDDFAAAFGVATASPVATRRVVVITSSLSKAAVTEAFQLLEQQPQSEAVHVLWLLSSFVDSCRNIGAIPLIVCRP
jgi:hypothetical protein